MIFLNILLLFKKLQLCLLLLIVSLWISGYNCILFFWFHVVKRSNVVVE